MPGCCLTTEARVIVISLIHCLIHIDIDVLSMVL